jgi:hypothetical protein
MAPEELTATALERRLVSTVRERLEVAADEVERGTGVRVTLHELLEEIA